MTDVLVAACPGEIPARKSRQRLVAYKRGSTARQGRAACQRGPHRRWELVENDGTGAPTMTDMWASFAIATGGVLTLDIAAPPNGSSIWVRVVDEVPGAVFEQEITADLPANTQLLSPRLFIDNGATAAAVVYDCSGVYLETDY